MPQPGPHVPGVLWFRATSHADALPNRSSSPRPEQEEEASHDCQGQEHLGQGSARINMHLA